MMRSSRTWSLCIALGASAVGMVGCDDGTTGSGGATSSSASGTGSSVSSTGSGVSGDFSCAGHVTLTPFTGAMGTVQLQVRGSFGEAGANVEGASVDLCAKDDPTCQNVLGTGTTDADGKVDIAAPFGPNGFDGFGVVTKQDYYTSLLQGSLPYVPEFGRVGLAMAQKAPFDALLATSFGITLEPAKGHVLVAANDCDGKLAAGVTIAPSTGAIEDAYYLSNGQPDSKASATTADGQWIALNLAPGPLALDLVVDGMVVGHATVLIRAASITQLYLNPTP